MISKPWAIIQRLLTRRMQVHQVAVSLCSPSAVIWIVCWSWYTQFWMLPWDIRHHTFLCFGVSMRSNGAVNCIICGPRKTNIYDLISMARCSSNQCCLCYCMSDLMRLDHRKPIFSCVCNLQFDQISMRCPTLVGFLSGERAGSTSGSGRETEEDERSSATCTMALRVGLLLHAQWPPPRNHGRSLCGKTASSYAHSTASLICSASIIAALNETYEEAKLSWSLSETFASCHPTSLVEDLPRTTRTSFMFFPPRVFVLVSTNSRSQRAHQIMFLGEEVNAR